MARRRSSTPSIPTRGSSASSWQAPCTSSGRAVTCASAADGAGVASASERWQREGGALGRVELLARDDPLPIRARDDVVADAQPLHLLALQRPDAGRGRADDDVAA